MKCIRNLGFIILIFTFWSCEKKMPPNENIRIAIMADIHIQDVFGELEDINYKGIPNTEGKDLVIIRSMAAQLHSTRLFNENYFAFLAALNDVVDRGIEYVILPGDFSDDGQPFNIRGLKKILDDYSREKGLKFFLTTGNHDPVRPFAQKAGKADFLGEGGMNQPIFSQKGLHISNPKFEHEPLLSKDIQTMGYKGITELLSRYGFSPKKEYIYWETPFSTYSLDSYNYDEATKAASLEQRTYIMPQGYIFVPDVSYLVEPVDGIWLLAIDANVYIPGENKGQSENDSTIFSGASIGFNEVLSHKRHLLPWVENVARRAKERGKLLIAFSHYPMVEYNDDASNKMKSFFGERKMQLHRVPKEKVAEAFADAGIGIHIGGHMHLNDTGKRTTDKGNTLVNIQTPSLASYVPAYKILTIKGGKIEVETVVLDSVPRFDEFFGLYKQEHEFLKKIGAENVWKKDILLSESYLEFTKWHLKELVRLRFIPEDWPSNFQTFFLDLTGEDLLVFSLMKEKVSLEEFFKLQINSNTSGSIVAAKQIAKDKANEAGLQLQDFRKWNGLDLIIDFQKLRVAGDLAKEDIGKERLIQYKIINKSFSQNDWNSSIIEFRKLAAIFDAFLNDLPSDHFEIHLETGEIKNLDSQKYYSAPEHLE